MTQKTRLSVRVTQSIVFCVMVGRILVGFVWLNLVFWVMVDRLLVGYVWLNILKFEPHEPHEKSTYHDTEN
jgi:hypothetical protein